MKITRWIALGAVALLATTAQADDSHGHKSHNQDCPVGLVSGMDLDTEFGPGTAALTECIQKRRHVKVVVQLNQFCAGANQARDPVTGACTAGGPYALGNLTNMVDDYEITHGMIRGRDYEMVVVVHSGGGFIVVKDQALRAHGKPGNPYEAQVRALMNKGVKFQFCQNTTRAYLANGTLTPGNATAEIIEGVGYTTAGLTSIADYQARGYQYIQP